MQTEQPKRLLESFAILFYICKIVGIYSQDWEEFRKYKYLKKSPTGECLVVISAIILFINFNLMVMVFLSKIYIVEKDPLAIGISFILTYYNLALFICDRVNALLKQKGFLNIFIELEEIDEDLSDLNIFLSNKYIMYRLVVGIFMAIIIEAITFTITFTYYVDKVDWTAWLWIYGYIPSFFNTLDKLWYIGILIAIRIRFESINKAFDMKALRMEQKFSSRNKPKTGKKFQKTTQQKKCTSKNQIQPELLKKVEAVFGDVVTNPPITYIPIESSILAPPRTSAISSDSSLSTSTNNFTLEDTFIILCQLHNTLCHVTKQLNEVYAFPNLMQMGYGFCIVTAQLYFFYSANVGQETPSLFCPAKIWWISFIYIFYISSKCVGILYGNWLIRMESKKTGICIHRCGTAADNNDIYEMINHLSLKLFNHPSEFHACGYFPLNMKTLFGICGGITTYLIILIQFNIEEQQVKFNTVNRHSMVVIRNDTRDIYS